MNVSKSDLAFAQALSTHPVVSRKFTWYGLPAGWKDSTSMNGWVYCNHPVLTVATSLPNGRSRDRPADVRRPHRRTYYLPPIRDGLVYYVDQINPQSSVKCISGLVTDPLS